jgi:hypothetical protein
MRNNYNNSQVVVCWTGLFRESHSKFHFRCVTQPLFSSPFVCIFGMNIQGVYSDENCADNLDHGVLAVGYGTTEASDDKEGMDYFLVRNSWGATWGDSGYIKMAKVSPHPNGTCGILAAASRPTLRDDE